jgi:RND family efflux transporter MFP subunit
MKKLIGFALLVTLSIFVAACSSAEEVIAEVDQRLPVTVTEGIKQDITDSFHTIGEIKPQATFDVLPSALGLVEEIFVKEADRVQKGDVLYTLEVGNAKNNLQATESSLRTVRNNLSNQLADAKIQLEKVTQLFNQGAASQSEIDQINNQIRNINLQLTDANTAYYNQVESLKSVLDDRVITSPSDGFVANVPFEAGESVGAQDKLIIIDDGSFIAKTYLTSDQLRMIEAVQSIAIWIDGDSQLSLSADIKSIDYTKNETTGMYEVNLSIEESTTMLYDGEFIEVVFSTRTRSADLLPLKAIKRVGTETFMYYVEDEVVNRISLKTGKIVDDLVEVFGLPTGKSWVVKGADQVQDGSLVEVVTE